MPRNKTGDDNQKKGGKKPTIRLESSASFMVILETTLNHRQK